MSSCSSGKWSSTTVAAPDLVLSLTGFARKKWQAECAEDNPS